MATKTVSISEAAYPRLAHEKRAQESFTDVILRLTGRRSLRELSTIVPTTGANALAKAVASKRTPSPRTAQAKAGTLTVLLDTCFVIDVMRREGDFGRIDDLRLIGY